jgi:drug/metabolite transporter (DMT)-like permease
VPRQGSAGVGFGLALLSAASFSTSGSIARSLTNAGWSPSAAVTARIGLATLMLAAPAILSLRGRWPELRRNLGAVTLFGVVAVAGCQVVFFNAVQRLPVGVALLIEYLGTVLVVGWLWLRHGERPRRLTVLGSLIAVVGLVLVLDLAGAGHLDPVGVLWALAAAVGLAGYFVLSARQVGDLPPVAMAGAGMGIGTVALVVLGALGALPMHATFGQVELAGRRTSWLVPVLWLSLVAAALAYTAGIGAARRLGAKLASFLGLTEVVFAVLVAWLLLGELPTWLQLVGGLLIVAGVAVVRLDELRRSAAGSAPAAPEPVLAYAKTASGSSD